MSIELKIPEVGESVQEVYIVRWFKQEGEHVDEDEDVVELESEKASLEVPAPAGGVIERILHPAGSTVQVGETIALIREGDEAPASQAAPATEPTEETAEPAEDTAAGTDEVADEERSARPRERAPEPSEVARGNGNDTRAADAESQDVDRGIAVTPSARRELRKHGLQPSDVPISGKRMRREDVEKFVRKREKESKQERKSAEQPAPPRTAASPPPAAPQTKPAAAARPVPPAPVASDDTEELVPLSPIRRRIAERLVRGQRDAALLTTFNEIDMSAVIDLRRRHQERFQKKHGVKLGFMSFFVKATAAALNEIPELNAEIRDEHIVYRRACHIGVAVGTSKGLLVPVLRHAEQLGFAEVELAIQDFAARAEAGKLRPDDLQGGTFTISNGGVYGSLLSTPLINPPQSGVLGMHTIQERPIGVDGQIVLRPMMYIALTYDHRIVDGREAVTFLGSIKQAIEDPTRMLFDT